MESPNGWQIFAHLVYTDSFTLKKPDEPFMLYDHNRTKQGEGYLPF